MKIRSYSQALKYLFNHIPDSKKRVFSGEAGLLRMKALARLLGDPQEKYPVIHVAGTSGKGSTATMISELLTAHGLRVSLHVSPHLVDIRERFQINRELISKEKFIESLNKIIPFVEAMRSSEHGSPTYFEINTALAYSIFLSEKVDVAVIETGLGGLLDGTNIVSNKNKLCVLTRIGLDHTEILGHTLPEIASQKAGIIQPRNIVIALKQDSSVMLVFEKTARAKKAKLKIVPAGERFELGVEGEFQQENAALAVSAVRQWLGQQGHEVSEERLRSALKSIKIQGRFDEVIVGNKTVIIDGAHNPEKMMAFISSLADKYSDRKFYFIVAFKKGKNYAEMLPIISPYVQEIVFTRFSSSQQEAVDMSEDPRKLEQLANKLNIKNISVNFSPKKALKNALKNKEQIIVVVGSVYLQEEIYRCLKTIAVV